MGTIDDWRTLHAKSRETQRMFHTIDYHDFDHYFNTVDIILQKFVETRELQESGTVDASAEIKDWWARIITKCPQGSGSQYLLSGWLPLLFVTQKVVRTDGRMNFDNPTTKEEVFPDVMNIFDLKTPIPEIQHGDNYYKSQDVRINWCQVARMPGDFPASMSSVPVELNDHGIILNLECRSGFIGHRVIDDSIQPVIGFYILAETQMHPVVTLNAERVVLEMGLSAHTAENIRMRETDPDAYIKTADGYVKSVSKFQHQMTNERDQNKSYPDLNKHDGDTHEAQKRIDVLEGTVGASEKARISDGKQEEKCVLM